MTNNLRWQRCRGLQPLRFRVCTACNVVNCLALYDRGAVMLIGNVAADNPWLTRDWYLILQSKAAAGDSLRLSVINGFRGLAILLVIYQHAIVPPLLAAYSDVTLAGIPFRALVFKQSWITVNLFFILSGFVLFIPYYKGRREIGTRASFFDFYQRRYERLMPLFFINVLVCTFVSMRVNPWWWESFWRTITTVSMFSDFQWFPTINPSLWTLMLEIWFSILFPVMLIALSRLGWVRMAVCLFTLGFVTRLAGFYNGHISLHDSLPARLDDFFVGMILCKVYFEGRLSKIKPLPMILAGGVAVTVACAMGEMRTEYKILPPYVAPFMNNFLHVGFFAISLGIMRTRGAIYKFCTAYPFQILGMMCYSIYLWHLIMMEPLTAGWVRHPLRLLNYAAWLMAFCALSYRYIEFGQVKDWKKLFTVPREDAATPPAPKQPIPAFVGAAAAEQSRELTGSAV